MLSALSLFIYWLCVSGCQAAIERRYEKFMFLFVEMLIKTSPPVSFCFTSYIFIRCRSFVLSSARYSERRDENSMSEFCFESVHDV
jgi:hypothetical protein